MPFYKVLLSPRNVVHSLKREDVDSRCSPRIGAVSDPMHAVARIMLSGMIDNIQVLLIRPTNKNSRRFF